MHVLLDKSRMGMCFSVYSQFSSSKNFWECVVYIRAPWDTFSFVSPTLIHCNISDVRWLVLQCSLLSTGFMESNIWSTHSHIFCFTCFQVNFLHHFWWHSWRSLNPSAELHFSLVAYGYLTGGAGTVQMRICLWVFSYLSFCESGCCIFY